MTDTVKRLEDRPELKSTLFESILNHLPHPVLLIAGRSPYELLFANSAARELFHPPEGDSSSPAEWTDIADSLSFNSPEALKQVMPAMVLAKNSGEALQEKCTITRPDGTSRRLIAHAANVDGNLLYSFYDSTRLQAAEQELAEARAELEQTAYSITENIPIGTYTMVLRPGETLANFVFMSSKFLQITGLTRQEAQENPLKAFACVHPEDFDEWVDKNSRTFVNKTPFREETRLLIDGKVSWVIAESVPRMQEDGTWIWEGVIQDITAQKLAEIALKDATEKLIESTRLNSRMEERQRMLRDIHDGFGNQLAVGKLQLRRGAGSASHAEQILDDCLADLKLLFESLDTGYDGLLPALVNVRQRMDDRTRGLPVKLLPDYA